MDIDVARRDLEGVRSVAQLMRILADPNRLHIVNVLTADCQSVSDIVVATNLPQPLVSHHLRVMRDHGLAQSERRGAFTYY